MAEMQRGSRTNYDVTPKQFIEAWETSSSVDQVAATLGMPKPIVMARKSNYTKLGIKLKKMPRKPVDRNLDVEALNALIEEIDRKRQKPSG